jgi:hypothetical protein
MAQMTASAIERLRAWAEARNCGDVTRLDS